MKSHNVLLTCALGAASLLGAAAPASAAHVSVGTVRPAATGRVLPGSRYYGTGYRGYGYRYGYGYPYRYGYRYGYGYPFATATATPPATASVLASATATLAEVTATLAGATGTHPIRPRTGLRYIWHVGPIGVLIAAHIGDGPSFGNASLPFVFKEALIVRG